MTVNFSPISGHRRRLTAKQPSTFQPWEIRNTIQSEQPNRNGL